MTIRQFYAALGMVTLITGITLYCIYRLVNFQSGYFPLIGLIFFFLFSILIFHLGKSSTHSADKHRFTSVVMSMIFLKLVLTVVIVIGFDRWIGKVHLHHVVSFLISYLFFTIYEVYFMSKLAKASGPGFG